jgi:transposase
MSKIRFVGLDVHAETIAVAVADLGEEVRWLGIIPNREDSIRRLVKKLGPAEQLRACYEAGPTGYVVYWQLTALSVKCEVVAPMLVPVKAGDRVKTDRRDAEKLARSYRSGDLTPVWVPDAAHEGAAGFGTGTRGSEEGPTAGSAPVEQVPAAAREEATRGHEGLDAETYEVGKVGRPFRATGAGGHAPGLRE